MITFNQNKEPVIYDEEGAPLRRIVLGPFWRVPSDPSDPIYPSDPSNEYKPMVFITKKRYIVPKRDLMERTYHQMWNRVFRKFGMSNNNNNM